MVNKRVRNAVLGCNLKNDRMISVRSMISVHFQGKPFNITVIQVYAATSNAEEAEVERFYEDLQDLLENNKESYLTLLPPAFPKIIDQRTHFWFSHNTSYSIYQLVNFIFYSIVQKCYPLVVNQTIQNVLAIPNVIYYVSVFIKLDMRHLF